jgi:hypothetical protein
MSRYTLTWTAVVRQVFDPEAANAYAPRRAKARGSAPHRISCVSVVRVVKFSNDTLGRE